MKNIFKHIAFLIIAGLTMVSCDYDETNYDALFNDVAKNASQYVQFKNAKQSFRTSVNEEGEIIDIETTVGIGLLGLPLSQDLILDIEIDPSTTIDPEMYELSATTVTIPAGETSASVILKTNTEEMPVEETLKLVLNIDAGEYNASHGMQLVYDLYRINFCSLDMEEFVGSWTGDTAWGPTAVKTSFNNEGDLQITGIGVAFMTGYWGEVILDMATLPMQVHPVTGEFTIKEAEYLKTTYKGDIQPGYRILGSGKLDACNGTMELYYDLVQPGVLNSYVEYFGSQDYFTEIIQIN